MKSERQNGVRRVRTSSVSTYALYYTPFPAEMQVLLQNLQEKIIIISIFTAFLGCNRDLAGDM
jgi:hypothetical protein